MPTNLVSTQLSDQFLESGVTGEHFARKSFDAHLHIPVESIKINIGLCVLHPFVSMRLFPVLFCKTYKGWHIAPNYDANFSHLQNFVPNKYLYVVLKVSAFHMALNIPASGCMDYYGFLYLGFHCGNNKLINFLKTKNMQNVWSEYHAWFFL